MNKKANELDNQKTPVVEFYDAGASNIHSGTHAPLNNIVDGQNIGGKKSEALTPAGGAKPGKPAVEIGLREDNMSGLQKAMRKYNPWFIARNYFDTLGTDNSDLDPTERPKERHPCPLGIPFSRLC